MQNTATILYVCHFLTNLSLSTNFSIFRPIPMPRLVDMDCGVGESIETSFSADTTYDPGNFECNICFELPQEPIVTLCGHLYCWPCLYRWLRFHSHSHVCPVCKAVVQEDKLIPVYGRGKTNGDPRSRPIPGVTIPNRPMGQRPPTAPPPHIDLNYVRPNDLDPMMGFMPMAAARFGHQTLSSMFGYLPAIFNLHMHGYHDATVYGTTSGFPYMFSGSFHGGHIHGFHHYNLSPIEWVPIAWKITFVVLGILLLLHLLLA